MFCIVLFVMSVVMGEGKRVGRQVQHWVREVECTEVEWLGRGEGGWLSQRDNLLGIKTAYY